MLVRAMTRVQTLDRRRADDDENSRIWEFSRDLDRVRLEIAAQLDLGITDLQALHVVHSRPLCTPGQLARALDLTVSGTSAVIERLVSRHLTERRRHPVDRRSLQLEVTTSGRHAVRWSTDEIARRIVDVLQTFELRELDLGDDDAAHAAPGRADQQGVPAATTRVHRFGSALLTPDNLATGSGS